MHSEFKYADETEVRAAQLMTQDLANHFGNVHGGNVLHLVDNIAYVCAARYCGGVAVTAAVDRVDFHEPIHVGELLHVVARIVYVGRSSMEVEITLHAEDITTGLTRHTNTCHFTMVALEGDQPRRVPRLVCRAREDKARYIQAKMRRERGIAYREERDRFLQQFENLDDDALDALIGEAARP
ncbi:MAG TPA: acyl-CoA thioesterase [Armatimonadaceae bacterium]|nr:acyl-CoA thioesterase [Armatimonadaceae bacterium]